MDPEMEREKTMLLFLEEVAQQAGFVHRAWYEAVLAVKALDHGQRMQVRHFGGSVTTMEFNREGPSMPHVALEQLWFHLQNVLVATGIIRQLLWGKGLSSDHPRAPMRTRVRVKLRQGLGVTDDSVLHAARSIRNDFEHFDERLEAWGLSASDDDNVIDKMIGPQRMGVPEMQHCMRGFDPATGEVTFLDRVVNLKDVWAEVRELKKRAADVKGFLAAVGMRTDDD